MNPKNIDTESVQKIILEQGILPLYFHKEASVSLEVLRAVHSAGVQAIEYTNRGDEAVHNFKEMIALRNKKMPEMSIGIGTIKNLLQAKMYLDAGADFLVSPGFVHEVASYCVQNDVFYAPGCMTPSEIIAAENVGIRFIKLFPGNVLGPEYMATIKDIFPKLLFMPTGGVDTTYENIKSWFDAGVSAVGLGSKLISKKCMEAREYDTISIETQKVLELIKTIKN